MSLIYPFLKNVEQAVKNAIHTLEVIQDLSGQALTAGDDVFSEDLGIDFDGWVRVQVVLTADAVVEVKLNGAYGALNNGTALTAGNLYEFDVTVTEGDSLNLRVSASQTPSLLRLIKCLL